MIRFVVFWILVEVVSRSKGPRSRGRRAHIFHVGHPALLTPDQAIEVSIVVEIAAPWGVVRVLVCARGEKEEVGAGRGRGRKAWARGSSEVFKVRDRRGAAADYAVLVAVAVKVGAEGRRVRPVQVLEDNGGRVECTIDRN